MRISTRLVESGTSVVTRASHSVSWHQLLTIGSQNLSSSSVDIGVLHTSRDCGTSGGVRTRSVRLQDTQSISSDSQPTSSMRVQHESSRRTLGTSDTSAGSRRTHTSMDGLRVIRRVKPSTNMRSNHGTGDISVSRWRHAYITSAGRIQSMSDSMIRCSDGRKREDI